MHDITDKIYLFHGLSASSSRRTEDILKGKMASVFPTDVFCVRSVDLQLAMKGSELIKNWLITSVLHIVL